MIEPLASLVPMRLLQTFFFPEAFNLLVIYPPTFDAKQLRDFAIAIAAVLLRQTDHGEP